MVNEPGMIWDGNLIPMHTTWLFFYSKTTIRHYPIFPQASPKPSSLHTQGEMSSLHEVTSITCSWHGKKRLWVIMCCTSPLPTSHHIIPSSYLKSLSQEKGSQSCQRGMKLVYQWKRWLHDNLAEGLLWYVCTALCTWPILTLNSNVIKRTNNRDQNVHLFIGVDP